MKKKLHICLLLPLWILTLLPALLAPTVQAQTIESVIPAESFLYLKIQNLGTCQEIIETSDSWKTASHIIPAYEKWLPVQQFMQMLSMSLGTDIQQILETFLGNQIAITVSHASEGLMIGLVIQNVDKTQAAEQIFSKLSVTLKGMGSEVNISEDTYRDIHYHTLQRNEQQLSYGSVGDFFLIGTPVDSFKKMVDIHKKQDASLLSNPKYRALVETYGNSDFFAFVDVTTAAPILTLLLPPIMARELTAFETLGFRWELLRTGGGLRFFGQLKSETETFLISRLVTETVRQTRMGVSGTEDIFVALAPSIAPMFWQMFLEGFSSDVRSFLFPSAVDWQAALVGELTLSADVSSFFSRNRYIVDKPDGNQIASVHIDFPPANFGILLKPNAPKELRSLFNGFIEKISIPERRRQADYKGITMNTDSIPGTLYYGNIKDFFLLTFSEQQFQTMVDNVLNETHTNDLQLQLALMNAQPTALLQIKLGPFVNAIAAATPWLTEQAAGPTRQIGAHLVSLSLQEKTVSLNIAHAQNEKGIEVVGQLAPTLFLSIAKLFESSAP